MPTRTTAVLIQDTQGMAATGAGTGMWSSSVERTQASARRRAEAPRPVPELGSFGVIPHHYLRMRRKKQILTTCLALVCLGGCAESGPSPGHNDSKVLETTDNWVGQWNGPEGTYLRLEGGDGEFKVSIRDLDGETTYQGTAAGPQIRFKRNGVMESIQATSGADTGMKWLADKSNCLTVRAGEGYCRD